METRASADPFALSGKLSARYERADGVVMYSAMAASAISGVVPPRLPASIRSVLRAAISIEPAGGEPPSPRYWPLNFAHPELNTGERRDCGVRR